MARLGLSLGLCLLYCQGCTLFLLDPQCTVSGPCSCNIEPNTKQFSIVPEDTNLTVANFMCQNHAFTSIAGVFGSTVPVDMLVLHFEGNQIQVIHSNVTKDLVRNNPIIERGVAIFLNNNRITTIEKDAFAGLLNLYLNLANNNLQTLENGGFGEYQTIMFIDLRNNSLSAIPKDLLHTSLTGLRLEGNPISTLDGNTLASINHDSVGIWELSLGLGHMSRWPHELHLMTSVESLSLYDIPFYTLDSGAFHSFEYTLESLSIINSKLSRVPHFISGLNKLESLSLKDNKKFDQAKLALFDTWTTAMPLVTQLEISGSDLTVFPDVFRYFPNTTQLVLSDNKLDFIDTKYIMVVSNLNDQLTLPCHVESINLDNNEFTRIPTALTALGNCLKSLSMQSNKITTLEFFDLRYFRNITELYLQNNPLKYITPFLYAPLQVLRLDNTNLHTVPTCVQNMGTLNNFGITGVQIECSCSSLVQLKSWNTSALSVFDGSCEYSSRLLRSYIDGDLSSCPDDPNPATYPDLHPMLLSGLSIN